MSDNEGAGRMTAEEMDEQRSENIAYQYLCRLEESKKWIEACIGEEIAATVELEEHLRNGVTLAKLAHFISPQKVSLKKIYDLDLSKYESRGLHFRHTDNINHFLRSLKNISFPEIFYPETTDVYDRKNIPRLIYCIHALSLYMFKIGRAPQILDLYGKIQFTEEEISNMKKELDKYGISMPSFSKIGGILASEMPVDEAELHAAVIAINTALDENQAPKTYAALCNPAAHLNNISEEYADEYHVQLYEAKNYKAETARNKSIDTGTATDAYDEMLTQAEIQGLINQVNLCYTVSSINEMLRGEKMDGLLDALRAAGLSNVESSNVSTYVLFMRSMMKEKGEDLNKSQLQKCVNNANLKCLQEKGVKKINQSLEGTDVDVTMACLLNPDLSFSQVRSHAPELYHYELQMMRQEKESDLTYSDINRAVQILNAIADVNQHVDSSHLQSFISSINNKQTFLSEVDDQYADKYLQRLKQAKKAIADEACPYLSQVAIQNHICDVNAEVAKDHELVRAIEKINEAVVNGDAQSTYETLVQEEALLSNVREAAGLHYYDVMRQALVLKRQDSGDDDDVLWMEDIQKCIDVANEEAREAENISARVAAINVAIDNKDEEELQNFLAEFPCKLKTTKYLTPAYLTFMNSYKQHRILENDPDSVGSGWMRTTLKTGSKYHFNVNSLKGSWVEPQDFVEDASIITRKDIETCVKTVNEDSHLMWLFKSREPFVIKLQAHAKGWLLRKQLEEQRRYFASNKRSIILIQRWWRDVVRRMVMQRKMEFYKEHSTHVVQTQAAMRMFLAKKKYQDRLQFFKDNEDSVIKIQSFVKAALTHKDYKTLKHGDKPSLAMIRKYVHLLDVTEEDYAQQIELDNLKQQLVKVIRRNQQLDQVLNEMDVKIGLLVKNRISLQDVISQNKSLNSYNNAPNNRNSLPASQGGLKALSKTSHDKLHAYQHLFYLLQTRPHYLAKLIFLSPQMKTTKFMETAILSIFHYAANQRDEFMLLALFKTALQEEIMNKITAPSDVSTGNSMVVKHIVSFNRKPKGQNVLRDLLGGLVADVLNDKNLAINTNVVDVYKHWVNSIEAETGKASGMPYEVTVEQALSHEEVSNRISKTIHELQTAADHFQTYILNNIHLIPYGMRYMAKVMKDTLHERFPDSPEKEILKVIGNFIYYRYINSAIVAPDSFDIIEVSASKGLSNEQRRNLGSIAKILQFSASNKGFGSDCPHLVCMNKYIMEAHGRFKEYFAEVCNVEDPEVVFSIDKYSDISRITKPVIFISVGEIVEMHRLLIEHASIIAPSPQDPLHELLADLGEVWPVEALLGEQSTDENKGRLAKTEITMTLSSKHDVVDDADTDLLWVHTKQMVVDVLRCQKGMDNLISILNTPASQYEENIYKALISERGRKEKKTDATKISREVSLRSPQKGDTLEELKGVVKRNLDKLEQAGYVTSDDSYQQVFNSILKDFRNLRLQRQLRRREMKMLTNTLNQLQAKGTFFEEQINYYNQYVQICLGKQAAKAKKKTTVKYTAAKLHEKGVLLKIEGLTTNQFKNVLFDITCTESPGIFLINVKLLGVSMEQKELNFQDLLELQYQGQAILKLFDRAQVNVNLLIHLFNKKFYGMK